MPRKHRRGTRDATGLLPDNAVLRNQPAACDVRTFHLQLRALMEQARRGQWTWARALAETARCFPSLRPRSDRSVAGRAVTSMEPERFVPASVLSVKRKTIRMRLGLVPFPHLLGNKDLLLNIRYENDNGVSSSAYAVCRSLDLTSGNVLRDQEIELDADAHGVVLRPPHASKQDIVLRIMDPGMHNVVQQNEKAEDEPKEEKSSANKRQKIQQVVMKRHVTNMEEKEQGQSMSAESASHTIPSEDVGVRKQDVASMVYCIRIKCGQKVLRPMLVIAPHRLPHLVFELSWNPTEGPGFDPELNCCERAADQHSLQPSATLLFIPITSGDADVIDTDDAASLEQKEAIVKWIRPYARGKAKTRAVRSNKTPSNMESDDTHLGKRHRNNNGPITKPFTKSQEQKALSQAVSEASAHETQQPDVPIVRTKPLTRPMLMQTTTSLTASLPKAPTTAAYQTWALDPVTAQWYGLSASNSAPLPPPPPPIQCFPLPLQFHAQNWHILPIPGPMSLPLLPVARTGPVRDVDMSTITQ